MKINGIEITGAIFDMDGTLLDSMGTWYTVGSDYMRSLGMTPPPTLDEDILRLTLEDAARHIQSLGVDKPVPEIHAGINGVMDDYFLNRAECRPGVADFLEMLRTAGIPITIATASDRTQVENGLKHAGIFHYIDRIFTCTELNTGKHETKVFDSAREFMGTDIESTWVFEDARHAAQTAKRGGYKVLGIWDASEPDQKELQETADVYVREFVEVKCC